MDKYGLYDYYSERVIMVRAKNQKMHILKRLSDRHSILLSIFGHKQKLLRIRVNRLQTIFCFSSTKKRGENNKGKFELLLQQIEFI